MRVPWKILVRAALFACLSLAGAPSYAGYDAFGRVPRMWVDSAGNLWFRLDNNNADGYCAQGWYGFNLYVPAGDSNYAFYYGTVVAAVSKNLPVYIANISVFNGTTACDITRTGYGIVLQQQ